MKKYTACALLLISAFQPATGASGESFDNWIEHADKEKSFAQKVVFYGNAITAWQDNDGGLKKGLAYERLGVCRIALDHLDEAAADLKSALDLNPHSFSARAALAHVYTLQNKCDMALGEIEEAKKDIPEGQRAPLYYQCGLINLLCRKNDKAAEADFTKAIKTAPKAKHMDALRKSYLKRGVIRCRKGKFASGISDIKAAGKISSPDNEYLFELGICYRQKEDFKKALANLI